ncbi:amidohydrolase family protein [Pseudofrankia inefficax]|uniref:Amidohydrolase 2 n=1 Tax=Pseudofrankia inefficax (strain DSM 45817 / CECT 9037 / DDB 130130 / EuI1c) TaxID=298654 RepID=E3J929_PSEI1|nr:amidohydrolase family protein [Pseudofrankia inefficax]ADP80908.1 amidohydrolase 2 [Pseudofrankia inefficax]
MIEPHDIPRIISVDDHVLEPPTLWTDRLPSTLHDVGPRVERQRIQVSEKQVGGQMKFVWEADDAADWVDVWRYEDLATPLMLPNAAVGFDELAFRGVTFDQVAPGAWQRAARLADMDANHVEASLCFPNTLPRFCGQAFLEAKDRELAMLCVRAYNDWLIEDWCAGAAVGRILPVVILPLWSIEECVKEIRRNVERGANAITFPENPYPLGLPSLHSDHWNPVFETCQELGVVVCMHIGSSSKMPTTTPDAPWIVSSTLTFQNGLNSLVDFIFSGILERYPRLRIAYSEAQVGWMPYVLERADKLWAERSDNSFGHALPRKPSEYIAGRVYGCIFDDETGLRNRDVIGVDQICFETDYPHADSTFPHSRAVLAGIAQQAELTPEELYKLARGNAIQLFDLGRHGLA